MSTYSITGASSGIGAATALALKATGHDVFAGVESVDDGRETLAGGVLPAAACRARCDSEASIRTAAEELERRLAERGLHDVVNNAGIGFPAPLESCRFEDLRRLLEVNVGQVAMTQAALPLIRQTGGRVVFVGPVGGVVAAPLPGPGADPAVRQGPSGSRHRVPGAHRSSTDIYGYTPFWSSPHAAISLTETSQVCPRHAADR